MNSNFEAKNFEVTLVKASGNHKTALHDSRILTDYLLIKSGGSFNFFFKNSQVRTSRDLEVAPYTKHASLKNAKGKNVVYETRNVSQETIVIGSKSLKLFEHA